MSLFPRLFAALGYRQAALLRPGFSDGMLSWAGRVNSAASGGGTT